MPNPVVVAELVRSGFVEGHHHGSVVALARDGSVEWSVGSVDEPVLPRSCNKPVQALAMVRLGLDLPPDLLALACASHSGEPFHVDGVRRILATADLDESALQTPVGYPLDDVEQEAVVRAGGHPSSILMNCSGKHAAMLATCVANGWDPETYLAVDHPLQAAIRETFEELTGERSVVVAIDGCGAPLLSASLTGLATAFRSLAVAEDGPERRIADAIRAHPEFVSGTRRDERAPAGRHPWCGREGRRRVLLRRRAGGRPGLRAQDRRRRGSRAARRDGGCAAEGRHRPGGRGRRRRRTPHRRGAAARGTGASRGDPGDSVTRFGA